RSARPRRRRARSPRRRRRGEVELRPVVVVRSAERPQLRLPGRRRPPRRLSRVPLRQRAEAWRPGRRHQGPVARRHPARRPAALAALARLAWLGLARDRPFDDRIALALLAADDDLQRLADLVAAAEIDAVAQADRRAGGPQPPA